MQNNRFDSYDSLQTELQQEQDRKVAVYLGKVMGWMGLGLLTTLVTALFIFSMPPLLYAIVLRRFVMIGIFAIQFVLVIAISAALHKMSATTATVLFLLFAACMGATFVSLFLIFETFSLIFLFGITALMFGGMSAYGMMTKKDLTGIGTLAVFGLFGILIAGVVNLFIGSGMADLLISVTGVVVFVILTAYDTQKIKAIYLHTSAEGYDDTSPRMQRLEIFGAMTLYLDFINLFLKLLQLFGKRK